MSAEADFRAALAAYSPLTALVGTRIAQNAAKQGDAAPFVVFTAEHDRTLGLDNTLLADRVTFSVQCWAATAVAADAIAEAVTSALAPIFVPVLSSATGYDPETGLDAVMLTIDWFIV